MKFNHYFISILLLLISCSTPTATPRYNQLTQNYEMVDRIVKNPDSLYFWIKDSNYVCKYYLSYYSKYYTQHNFSNDMDMIISKINDNNFKNGYTYFEDIVKLSTYKCYLEHWLCIKSNNSGKKIFLDFNNDEGTWKIYRIMTHIQFGIDYNIEIED